LTNKGLDGDGPKDDAVCDKCLGARNECADVNNICNELKDTDKDGLPDGCDIFPEEQREALTCGHFKEGEWTLGHQVKYLGTLRNQCCTKKLADALLGNNNKLPGYDEIKCIPVDDAQKDAGWLKEAKQVVKDTAKEAEKVVEDTAEDE
jgi:hypothetical protein